MKYDFSGWATKNNLKCSDGRVIRKDAFKDNDGQVVPLVWMHQHDAPDNVLGHALLENRDEGVYAYCTLNDTETGKTVRELITHGDVSSLSIYANRLKQKGSDVFHGAIREVSVVLSPANPGAVIENLAFEHSDGSITSTDDEAIMKFYGGIELAHADDDSDEEKKEKEELQHADESEEKKGEKEVADNKERTVADVYNEFTEEQKKVVAFIVGQALEDAGVTDEEDEEEGEEEVKHNVFDNDSRSNDVLSHSDMESILTMAKSPSYGSFRAAVEAFEQENDVVLMHDATASGFTPTGNPANVSLLFPEYADVNPGGPELITNDQGWINIVLNKVHKSPISRVRTSSVDIRNIDALRAKGYKKGKEKAQTGNFNLVRRTTDPQTIYVKSALHRDDIVDITDFDYVDYLYRIDRMNLNEELVMAIMLGDFRADEAEDKISADHIRPIWTDDSLYTLHYDIDVAAMKTTLQGTETGSYFGDNYIYAEALIEKLLYAREEMKGSGSPDFFMTPHMLNVMLLARDRNGRRIFGSKAELASALNVGNIYTAEQFANRIRTDSQNAKHKLLGICVNLSDYNIGSTKGGEITHFTDFDIDFNQHKSLLETRVSGALTRVYSAVVIEEPYAGE